MEKPIRCPKCGLSTYLYFIRGRSIRRCCGYPDCDYVVDTAQLKKHDDAKAKKESQTVYLCNICKKGRLIKKHGKKGVFWGCEYYPECQYTCNDYLGKPSTIRVHEWVD